MLRDIAICSRELQKQKSFESFEFCDCRSMRNEEVEKKNSYETDIHVPVAHTRSQILFDFFLHCRRVVIFF